MSVDWEHDPEWLDFVQHFREDAVAKLHDSAFVISLIPREDFDVKFATELGAAIMLDKPMIGVVMPGQTISGKLARVFDKIIEVDVDTERGRATLRQAMQEIGL